MVSSSFRWAPGEQTTITTYGAGDRVILLAHGAGTDQAHASIVGLAGALAARDLTVCTFDYPYTAAGRRRPDRAPRLLACHRAVFDEVAATHGQAPFLAGRSMGGRMGTMLAAEGLECPGVVCFAYPLHPAGRPERLRIEHLPDITVPKLFFQGSRDALATPALFDVHVRPLPDTTVVDLEGADHSFRGKGWSPERVWALLADRTREWIDLRVGGKRPGSR